MPRFRKRPVVIEAEHFDSDPHGVNGIYRLSLPFQLALSLNGVGNVVVKTLEGEMQVSQNDWIIRGVNGEFYPCKPDIFEKTYEPAE